MGFLFTNASEHPCGSYYSIPNVIGFVNVVAIVNPLSGAGANPDVAATRVAMLEKYFSVSAIRGEVHVSRYPGHAIEIAEAAVTRGAEIVIAWGGDGTVNEVGRVLAGTNVALGIVPAGSGNGFARDLGVPLRSADAIDVALHGSSRLVDVGEIGGRPFLNIAGIGFDAEIARRFNARAQGQRGLWPYIRIGVVRAFRYRAARYRISLDGASIELEALLVAFANGREYGNGLRLAPHASIADGKLDAVVVADRAPIARLWSARHLMLGTADRAPGVTVRSIERAEIFTEGQILFHVDGELGFTNAPVHVRIRPASLKVRVPKEAPDG